MEDNIQNVGEASTPEQSANVGTQDAEVQGTQDASLNAPEVLDFSKVTIPEGVEIDDAFKDLAKEIGLTNDSAGKLLEYAKANIFDKIQTAQAESRAKVVSDWEQQTRNEFSNEKLEIAKRAYNQFTDETFRQFMEDTGLGSNPAVVKVFYNIGALMQEGRLVLGEGHATPTNSANSMFAKSISMMGK